MVDQRLVERFHQKYEVSPSGCWLWTASCAGKGYGQIKVPGERRQMYAHRLSYLIHKGEVPEGKQICHTCDVPKCVNPEHLFVGTSQDNHDDMKAKDRSTHGILNKRAKLNEKMVRHIKVMLREGVPQQRVARAFDISQTEVSRIGLGLRWTRIK